MHEEFSRTLQECAEQLIGLLRLSGRVNVQERTRGTMPELAVTIDVDEHADVLIGKDGQTLDALEHIFRLLGMKQEEAKRRGVSLDINGYRKQRLDSVAATARQAAERVRVSGQAETLAPMSASERREVHTILTEYGNLKTESIGIEPMRRIVIKPSPEFTRP